MKSWPWSSPIPGTVCLTSNVLVAVIVCFKVPKHVNTQERLQITSLFQLSADLVDADVGIMWSIVVFLNSLVGKTCFPCRENVSL